MWITCVFMRFMLDLLDFHIWQTLTWRVQKKPRYSLLHGGKDDGHYSNVDQGAGC